MKTRISPLVVMLFAGLIVAILGFDLYVERRSFDQYAQEGNVIVKINYDCGWPRPVTIFLASGIILLQARSLWKQSMRANAD